MNNNDKIMLLKEIPKNTNLTKVKIRLNEELIEHYSVHSKIISTDVWLIGDFMGSWFISPDSPDQKKRELWPMPPTVVPQDFLECEIIDESDVF